jgi:UPF0716 family protein affecting phage T7 exclusion
MVTIADSIIDWGALWDVILISAIAGIAIATTLGIGVVASLRAQDEKGTGSALALNAVTVVSVLLVAAAVVVGIYYITDK